MGLDISYAQRWALFDDLSDGFDVDELDKRHLVVLGNYEEFHARASEFEIRNRHPHQDFVRYGAFYPSGKSGHTPIGSYSYYSWWRELLSREFLGVSAREVRGANVFSDKPFYELIDFADNEGTIGATASKKLSSNFRLLGAELRALAKSQRSVVERDNFMETYHEFERAFTIAALCPEGAVRFH